METIDLHGLTLEKPRKNWKRLLSADKYGAFGS